MEFKNPTAWEFRSRRGKDPPGESLGAASAVKKIKPPNFAAGGSPGQSATPDATFEESDINRRRSIPHLPAVFRTAMILSYLEGFSAEEIGRLAGVQPRAIESLLLRGRELMQEAFNAYVRSHDDID